MPHVPPLYMQIWQVMTNLTHRTYRTPPPLTSFFCTPMWFNTTNAKSYFATIEDLTTLGAMTADSTNEIRTLDGNHMKKINVTPFPYFWVDLNGDFTHLFVFLMCIHLYCLNTRFELSRYHSCVSGDVSPHARYLYASLLYASFWTFQPFQTWISNTSYT